MTSSPDIDGREMAPAPGPSDTPCADGARTTPGGPAGSLSARALCRLLESSPQPFAVADLEQRIIHANRAYGELLGYAPEDLLGLRVAELTASQPHDMTRRQHEDIVATGRNRRIVKDYRRRDGTLVRVEAMMDVFRDDEGRPAGVYCFATDISERIRAEEALRVSAEQYRELYDKAPVGYLEMDRTLRITKVNQTACELMGCEDGSLLGSSVLDLVEPDGRGALADALREKLDGMRPLLPYEQKVRTKDGRSLVVEIQERERRDGEGRVAGLRSVLQDVSGRKEAEARLIESERRARILFDGIHDAVFLHDQRGRILDANPAACRLLGYSRDELMSMTTSQIDSPEFAAGFEDRLRRQLQEGELSCEGLHRTKGGRLIPVEVTSSTVRIDQQTAILSMFRDITERKALERTRREFAAAQMRNAHEMERKNRALSESESRYRRLAEASLDGIVVADEGGRITLFNPAAEKMFGHDSGDVLGRPLDDLIPGLGDPGDPGPDRDVEEAAGAARPIFAGVGKTVELLGRRRDGGEFPLELSLSIVEVDGRPQYLGSIRDQTERQRMRAMLAHTDRLASIGLLSAGVAHEINNPLAYVLNNLAVLQREVKDLRNLIGLYESSREALAGADAAALAKIDEVAEEIDWAYLRENLEPMVERTRAGVQRVANIVGKMRGLARTTLPEWQVVPLCELVDGALEMMRGRLKHRRVDVAVRLGEVGKIECVPDQITQVLLNLLINALQAIEGSDRQEGGRIEIEASLSGPWVSVAVKDDGPGISPEHLDRLFDPFFTTKPVGEGTGLGLAISHQIIAGHGGRIEVEGRPGGGTCFRILLPRRSRRGAGPEASPAHSSTQGA
ncbi:Sporulation kinase E [Aquisphaera giovannonii]|uniref:histidine kinase n=1 Tax=Aquisphaera giovannonii TaxID=406548 RepID=A0A5B9WBM8_9BACT|nr:PAS domain S-box protein [Aquisphaera giovannonii]QEH37982.1 Sporulation kinase E [Aquisphaera giovannonii]